MPRHYIFSLLLTTLFAPLALNAMQQGDIYAITIDTQLKVDNQIMHSKRTEYAIYPNNVFLLKGWDETKITQEVFVDMNINDLTKHPQNASICHSLILDYYLKKDAKTVLFSDTIKCILFAVDKKKLID